MALAARTRAICGGILVGASVVAGCYRVLPSKGGGQVAAEKALRQGAGRELDPRQVAVPPGYRVEVAARGLTYPTAAAFDGQGRLYVVEAGYSYGEAFAVPRLVRVEADGGLTEIARGRPHQEGPWTGAVFSNGAFLVADGGEMQGGRILRIGMEGRVEVLIDGLPSMGDHHTNGPAVGPDGKIYFGVGTATNSGVVGEDDAQFGWLLRHPEFHDVPAKDVTLTGENFTTSDPRPGGAGKQVVTGAFSAFGTATTAGQVVKGQLPANGAVMRIVADATPGHARVELVAWGMRNPFGLAFAPDGRLLVAENQYDVRGSRPVWGTGDLLWAVDVGAPARWYGWPDFHGREPLTNEDWFKPQGKQAVKFLLAEHPNEVPEPAAKFAVHAGVGRLDVSRSERFGHVGEAFVAEFGDMAPAVGKVIAPVGFMVVRVDVGNGVVEPFAINRGVKEGGPYGPSSRMPAGHRGGLERPIDARFSPDGAALYVVDFGVMTVTEKGPRPVAGTGVVWRIVREAR